MLDDGYKKPVKISLNDTRSEQAVEEEENGPGTEEEDEIPPKKELDDSV